MTLHYEDGGLRLFHGSNRDILPTFASESFDSIVTDPPYELGFMGKGWDSSGIAYDVDVWRECFRVLKPGGHMLAFGGTRTWHRIAVAIEDAGFEIRDSIAWMYGSGFPKSMDVSKAIDKTGGASPEVQARTLRDARERAGMTREQVAEAVGCSAASVANWEDGRARAKGLHVEFITPGPEYRDALADLLGYSADERAIVGATGDRRGDGTVMALGHTGRQYGGATTDAAKAWEGWGTALKPAFEPIVVARKPLRGTVAANVLAYGTGAINIDATRIPHVTINGGNLADNPHLRGTKTRGAGKATAFGAAGEEVDLTSHRGRFPSNVLLDETQAAELDRQAPNTGGAGKASGPSLTGASTSVARGKFNGVEDTPFYRDSGGASRFFKIIKEEPCATAPENAMTLTATTATSATPAPDGTVSAAHPADANGGTSFPPFRYEAKAPGSERPTVDGVAHATVKPLELMRWLVRLVTRRGGHVLDLFAGSGTTGEAALLEGMDCTLIELESDHLPLIMQRIRKPLQASLFGDWEEEAS